MSMELDKVLCDMARAWTELAKGLTALVNAATEDLKKEQQKRK